MLWMQDRAMFVTPVKELLPAWKQKLALRSAVIVVNCSEGETPNIDTALQAQAEAWDAVSVFIFGPEAGQSSAVSVIGKLLQQNVPFRWLAVQLTGKMPSQLKASYILVAGADADVSQESRDNRKELLPTKTMKERVSGSGAFAGGLLAAKVKEDRSILSRSVFFQLVKGDTTFNSLF
jgi:hypothetical protein